MHNLCVEMQNSLLHSVDGETTHTLESFCEEQRRQKRQVAKNMDTLWDEVRKLLYEACEAALKDFLKQNGFVPDDEAAAARDAGLADLSVRYEEDLMNPKEALSLGSVSSVVRPGESRRVLAENLSFLMRRYEPSAMGGTQREHE